MSIIQSIVNMVKGDAPRAPVSAEPNDEVEALEAQVQYFDRQIDVLFQQKKSAAAALRVAIDARNAKNMAEALRKASSVSVASQVVDVSAGV